ncbi:J domain-containing protein [Dongia sp. agr-C8]
MFSPGQKKARNKYAVEVELDDGKVQTLFVFVAPDMRVIDMLNDERMFIPFETTDGTIVIYKKHAIKRLTELFAAERTATKDPYDIIDVSAKASDKEVHDAYRRAIASVHPDHIQALGLPQDFVELATRRAMAVNDAYDRIKRERNMQPVEQPPFN